MDTTDDDQEQDLLYGGDGDDELLGGSGGDKLYGEAGNDTLVAGSGDTHMEGGTGNDTYTSFEGGGGDGNDTLIDTAGDDTYLLSAGTDTITDIGGDDNYHLWASPLLQALTTASFNASSDSTCIDSGEWDTYVIHLGSLIQGGTATINDSDGLGQLIFDGQYLNGGTVVATGINTWSTQGKNAQGILGRRWPTGDYAKSENVVEKRHYSL